MKTITIRTKGSSLIAVAADKAAMKTEQVKAAMAVMKKAGFIIDPMDVTVHPEDGKIVVTVDVHTSNFELSPDSMHTLLNNKFFTDLGSSSEGEAISFNFTYRAS